MTDKEYALMITYHCPACDLRCESSTCPVCGSRTDPSRTIYWCANCNIPSWYETCDRCGEKASQITTDIRPVFPQERLLMELLLGVPLKYQHESVWYGSGRYIVNGQRVRLPSTAWANADVDTLRNELNRYQAENADNSFEKYANLWIEANAQRYRDITAEAMLAIQEAAKDFKTSEMFVSFSGGKDSTVTSSLVIRALGTPSIIHLYGNTTLEFPESEKYVARFRKTNRHTPLLVARNTDQNF